MRALNNLFFFFFEHGSAGVVTAPLSPPLHTLLLCDPGLTLRVISLLITAWDYRPTVCLNCLWSHRHTNKHAVSHPHTLTYTHLRLMGRVPPQRKQFPIKAAVSFQSCLFSWFLFFFIARDESPSNVLSFLKIGQCFTRLFGLWLIFVHQHGLNSFTVPLSVYVSFTGGIV